MEEKTANQINFGWTREERDAATTEIDNNSQK